MQGFSITQSQMELLRQAIVKKFPGLGEEPSSSHDGTYEILARTVETSLQDTAGFQHKHQRPQSSWFAELFGNLRKADQHSFNQRKLDAVCKYAAGVDAHTFFYPKRTVNNEYTGIYKCFRIENNSGLNIGFLKIDQAGTAQLKTQLKKSQESWYTGKFEFYKDKELLIGNFSDEHNYMIHFIFKTPFSSSNHLEGVYSGFNFPFSAHPFAGIFIIERLDLPVNTDLSSTEFEPFTLDKRDKIEGSTVEKYFDILLDKKARYLEGSTATLEDMGYAEWRK